MKCKYCKTETGNDEEICNMCMIFGPPDSSEDREEQSDTEMIQAGDTEIIQAGDTEIIQVDDTEIMQVGDTDIMQVGDTDIMQVGDTEIMQVGDTEIGQTVGSFKELYFHNIGYNYLNIKTIQSFRQNIPELIVGDCIKEFNLDDEQAEKLRIILMTRGVNKWFYARREFLRLRSQVKDMLKSKEYPYNDKKIHKIIEKIYVKMQNIAKMPRWVEWPKTVTHKWKNIEKNVKIKGRHS